MALLGLFIAVTCPAWAGQIAKNETLAILLQDDVVQSGSENSIKGAAMATEFLHEGLIDAWYQVVSADQLEKIQHEVSKNGGGNGCCWQEKA